MALEGTLADMSMADLFQIFQMGNKTGILRLQTDDQYGVVHVSNGRVIDGAILYRPDQSIRFRGEQAVLKLLQWPEATFSFRHDPAIANRAVIIRRPNSWLVLEALRQQKATTVQPKQTITIDTCVEPGATENSAEIGMGLDLDQWRILDHVVSRTSVRSIASTTRIEPPMLIDSVSELVATGLLQVALIPYRSNSATHLQHDGTATLRPHPSRIARPLLDAIQRRVRSL